MPVILGQGERICAFNQKLMVIYLIFCNQHTNYVVRPLKANVNYVCVTCQYSILLKTRRKKSRQLKFYYNADCSHFEHYISS